MTNLKASGLESSPLRPQAAVKSIGLRISHRSCAFTHLLYCLSSPSDLSGGLATPFASHWDDHRPKHAWNSVPENWKNLGHPPDETTIDLHIALKAQDENALIDALVEVSSPGPSKTCSSLPTPGSEHHGVHPSTISTKHGGSWLTLTGVPVSRANELLRASYQLYQHIGTNETVLRTLNYGLPAALVEAPADRNVLGVVGILGDSPNPDDLRQFMNQYRFGATSATYSVVQIKGGGYNPSNPSMEANVDTQYTSALAYPTTHIFYSTGDSGTQTNTQGDPFINWLDFVLDLGSVPQTVSTPYGFPEYKVPLDYATHVCNLFARLGARGASVLFASGNDGVGHGDCLFQDNSGNSRVQFLPTFPSTCPWVTSVGGTTGYNPEVAASLSGGGFSVYFPRPPYQSNAVPTFLRTLGGQYNGFYNPGGRGVPDIAVQAINFHAVFKQATWTNSGTSCAVPTAAGIISLLNDYRISIGRPPLGFLNIWLYGVCLPGLNDITSGSNPGCNTDGFSAVPGWDPVSGLGSLDFERLVAILSRW
ncbi:peptidase S8/S53 domain-containing protein [Lactarius deliciosus]|nr:peptidase S8/S53 domain-containing protein [Lactarius deliciosus]